MLNLDGVRVLSVDLFDTLVLRAVSAPAGVFPVLGSRAAASGLLFPHVTVARFALLRAMSEARARQLKFASSGTTEVGLEEVYEALPRGVVRDPAAAARLEVEIEAEVAYAHPVTLAMVREARTRGIATALVSDTCLAREGVVALLHGAGIPPELFDTILTSSDEGCSKHDGGLFTRLLERWPEIEPGSMLHVGDHAHADVRQARRAGLRALHHDTGCRGAVLDAMRLETLRYGSVLPELASLRARAATLAAGDPDARWWFELGASVMGPALSAFADWIVGECVRDGIRVIRPLMREGALFSRLIRKSAAAAGADLDVEPLYASRSATWIAGLETFDRDALHRLLQRQHLTIAEVLEGLGISGHEAAADLAAFGPMTLAAAQGEHTLSGRAVMSLLIETLEDGAIRQRVSDTLAGARRVVRRYLDESCGNAADVALVDLGFHNSIGRSIERATRDGSPRRYHHFLAFAADGVARLWAEGSDVRVFGAGPGENADLAAVIARQPAPLESLLVEGGTTLGYVVRGHVVKPVLADSQASERQQAATSRCRAGIEAFQSCWLEWRHHKPALAHRVVADRRGLTHPIHRLLTLPTAEEASKLGAFVHEDNDGGNSGRRLVPATGLPPSVGADEFLRATRSAGHAFGQTWLWPEGACECRWPGHLERRWREVVGSDDGAPPALPEMARRMRQAGVPGCVVWGAGEAGSALIRALRSHGLDVLLVTDSNPSLWGTTFEGIPVVSPEEARERGNHVFAIGSCAFAAEIGRTLRQHYSADERVVRVFSPVEETTA